VLCLFDKGRDLADFRFHFALSAVRLLP